MDHIFDRFFRGDASLNAKDFPWITWNRSTSSCIVRSLLDSVESTSTEMNNAAMDAADDKAGVRSIAAIDAYDQP